MTNHKVNVTLPGLGMLAQTAMGTLPTLVDDETSPGGVPRWLDGVTWQPTPCGWTSASSADGSCVAHVMNPALRRTCLNAIVQKPFRIDDAYRVSAATALTQDIPGDMAAFWAQSLSAVFASELVSGVASGGHSLSSTATEPDEIPFGSTAVALTSALPVIENELGRRIGSRRGAIHMPPGLLALAVADYGLQFIDGKWYTPAGNLIVVDGGYADAVHPVDAPEGDTVAAAVNEAWVYGTGPVAYAYKPPAPLEAIELERNEETIWNEGYGIWVFDPCAVTAVLVEAASDFPPA